MGAYENPQAVIDTGTPQILANAIGNLGKQAAGVLDQEKEKRIAAEKVRKEWLKYTFEFSMNEYDKVHEQMIENGATTAAAFNSLNPLISQSTASRISAAKANSPEEQAAYLKQANENQTQISQFLSGEKQMNEEKGGFAEKMGANPGLAGKEGGIPMAGKDDKAYIYSMSVMSNLNKGKFTKEYNSKTKEYDITVTSDSIKNDPDFEGDSITMPESELIGYDLGTLTKIKANQQKLIRPSDPDNNPDGLGIYNSEGTLAAKYIDKNKPAEYVYSTVNGVEMRQMSYLGNNELIDADLTPALKIKAMGLLANPTQAQKDWENTMLPNLTKEQLEATDAEGNKIFSDEILKGKLGFGSNSQGNDNIFDTASNAAFVKAYVDSGLAQVTRTTEKYPIEVVPKEVKPPKPPGKNEEIVQIIKNNLAKAEKELTWEGVEDFGSATFKSIGKTTFVKKLDEFGLMLGTESEPAEDGSVQYVIYNPIIPKAYGVKFNTAETIESINPKIKQAIGKLYPGVQEIDWSQPAN